MCMHVGIYMYMSAALHWVKSNDIGDAQDPWLTVCEEPRKQSQKVRDMIPL